MINKKWSYYYEALIFLVLDLIKKNSAIKAKHEIVNIKVFPFSEIAFIYSFNFF